MKVVAFGERALLVQLGRVDVNATKRVATDLRRGSDFVDVVAGSSEIAVFVSGPAADAVSRVEGRLAALTGVVEPAKPESRTHAIEVSFDGPDLARLIEARATSADAFVAAFVEPTYEVRLVGFLPGFAYLGTVPPELRAPRLPAPRRRVEPGSLGIAGDLAGVYPAVSPGGWNLVGRALGEAMFDPARDRPALLGEHDRVRFVAARDGVRPAPASPVPSDDAIVGPALRVLRAPPATTVQDAGRRGARHLAVPWSGPLDEETARAANRAVGNDPGAALVEVPTGTLVLVPSATCVVSIDGLAPAVFTQDEEIRVPETDGFVRYVAVRGGIDVPLVLGSRATFLPSGFGGLRGRSLQRGDVLPIGAAAGQAVGSARVDASHAAEPLVLDVTSGPHGDRFPDGALDTLIEGRFTVGAKSRVGTRLAGATVTRAGDDDRPPEPMVPGAVQVSTDGTPLVLGPDSATTGGYPVVAVLTSEAQARLGRARPGTAIRFRLA